MPTGVTDMLVKLGLDLTQPGLLEIALTPCLNDDTKAANPEFQRLSYVGKCMLEAIIAGYVMVEGDQNDWVAFLWQR